MNLEEIRKNIDEIDEVILEKFKDRMELILDVAKYKSENNMNVLDLTREREKLNHLTYELPEELRAYGNAFFSYIFELSKQRQEVVLNNHHSMIDEISKAIKNSNNLLPSYMNVACQGVEGSYSARALDKLFSHSNIMYLTSFESVFSAIENGLCKYGILPIENSTAGSVNKIYELMKTKNFYIIKSCRIKVDHCLLANKNAKLSDIREIYSHEQAIAQCQSFLNSLDSNIKIIPCENTAVAAKKVSESKSPHIAAISSRVCSELYSLSILNDRIIDQDNNYTRFICISKDVEILPGSNRTSLMMVLPNKPGSLYKVLSYFNSIGVNLIKLESRPLLNSDFEFMFYFDIECSIYSSNFLEIFRNLNNLSLECKYLGTYSEEV